MSEQQNICGTIDHPNCSKKWDGTFRAKASRLEAELASQKELLWEVLEAVRSAAFMQTIDGALNARDRARAILPKMEAELGEEKHYSGK